MLREKNDDVYRRNMLDVEGTEQGNNKRYKKQKYKIKKRHGGAYGTLAEKLDKKNKTRRRENDEAANKLMMLNNEMIFL
jgi:hypothetical protein